MNRHFLHAAALAATLTGIAPAEVAATVLTPSRDTCVTEHGGLGGANSLHGGDTVMVAITVPGSVNAFPMVEFDLSGFAGRTVVGDATLGLFRIRRRRA